MTIKELVVRLMFIELEHGNCEVMTFSNEITLYNSKGDEITTIKLEGK